MLGQAGAGLAQRGRADDRLRGAVVDDVGGLRRGQVGVDRHVVQTAAPSRPHHRVDVLVVLHQDGDRVTLAQTRLAEPARQSVGAGLEVVESDDGPGRVQDDSRFVGADIRADLHAQTVPPPKLTGVEWSRPRWADPATSAQSRRGCTSPAIMQSGRSPTTRGPTLVSNCGRIRHSRTEVRMTAEHESEPACSSSHPSHPDHPFAVSDYLDGMERLVHAIQELSLARSLPDIQRIVRSSARELTGCDGATFVLRENDSCYYADENAIAPLWKGSRFPIESCISGWAMLNRDAAVIPDIYRDPRIPHALYRATFVKSLVMVPIRKFEPIGAIGNYWASPHQPSDQEVHLLQALADSTSIAIENVQVYSELERRVRERTAALEDANEEIRRLSVTDELTGLNNRRGFYLLAEQKLRGSHHLGHNCVL